jgi:hypothetical protein
MDTTVAAAKKIKEIKTVSDDAGLSAEQRLAIAEQALADIVAENDLTCLRALFRMRRRAEVALARIASADSLRH